MHKTRNEFYFLELLETSLLIGLLYIVVFIVITTVITIQI